jgi:predicted transcriptional regulator
MTKTTSFRIDDELSGKVDALAATLDRPKGWIIEQALRRYVEAEGWQVEAIQGALDELRGGHAEFRSHDEVMARAAAKLKAHGIDS